MTSFEWTGAHELGHADIDAQHQRMFLLAEAVVDSLVEKGINKAKVGAGQLQALVDFTEEHFAFEEGLMRSTGYPNAEWHAKFHGSLLAELRTYSGKVQRGELTNAVGLVNFLWHWLDHHINSSDRALVVWLRSDEPDVGG